MVTVNEDINWFYYYFFIKPIEPNYEENIITNEESIEEFFKENTLFDFDYLTYYEFVEGACKWIY